MRWHVRDLRDRSGQGTLGKVLVRLANVVRRMVVTEAGQIAWTVEGFKDGSGNAETDSVEAFQGVGDWAKPGTADRCEVIVMKVGGDSGHGVAIAFRNVDALRRYKDKYGELADAARALFADGESRVYFANDEIHVEATKDAAASLAFKSALDAVADRVADLETAVFALSGATSYAGTTVLKGE